MKEIAKYSPIKMNLHELLLFQILYFRTIVSCIVLFYMTLNSIVILLFIDIDYIFMVCVCVCVHGLD